MTEERKRSYQITSEGKMLIAKIRQERGWNKNKLNQYLQEKTGIESIPRILRVGKAEENSIDLIAQALGILTTDLVDPNELYRLTEPINTMSSIVDWRSVSKGMLDNLKRLTTEALTAGDGIRFDFDDVFVPLGVVERRERTKRKEDDGAPDRGAELYEEKVTPITHKDFFEDVLLRGNTKISKGKRIAVIGEAGAGKTTQLQKIGSWLLEKSDDIPIWISLTELGTIPLEEFIFENWVRNACGKRTAPQEWKDSLEDAIASGKVWLLLDGVDEMTVSNPLSYLENQLEEGYLKNVRVVLTCRVNVWDGGKNALTGFDVYRNLDFDYPDDIYKFIGKWFVRTPELAGSLTQALEQSGKERIRDMVKNPLRLTLLCYSWQLKQGELPETKAGLYEWFVEAFYKWNKGKAQIKLSRSQEEQLNRALGELAKRAIDGENSRFRLTKTFIENVFREFDIDLFDVALKLNWLNEIGVAAEDPLETVYAFYHPSFQEYFAALAINDWDFFIPRDHLDRPLPDRKYRIFEPQWRYCFFLWIGQEKSISKSVKEEFLDVLWNFNDYCGRFYSRRGRCLAVEATGEFKNCDSQLSLKMIERTLKAAFLGNQYLIERPVVVQARLSLLEANTLQTLRVIENLINIGEILDTKELLECFGDFWSQSQEIIDLLLENKIDPRLFQHNKYAGSMKCLDSKSFHDLNKQFKNTVIKDFFSIESEYNNFTEDEEPIFSEEELEYWYQRHLEDMKLADEDHLIVDSKKDVESLIDIFYSDSRIVGDLSIVIDKIIEDYPDSEHGINFMIDILCGYPAKTFEGVRNHIVSNFTREFPFNSKLSEKLSFALVAQFGKYIANQLNLAGSNQCDEYRDFYEILWICASDMQYSNFYDAWHQPKLIHPEVIDFVPSCNTDSLRELEDQFIDRDAVQEELDRNADHPEIRCLVIDVRQLEQESDPNVIAKKLTNNIFNSIGRRIPVVQDVSCLERELLNLKFDLGVEKLAIALYGKSANEAIAQLCQNLAPIQTRLFTGGQTTEELIIQIHAWLLEM